VAAAFTDQLEQSAARVVVMLVDLEVFGKLKDTGGQNCDLNLRGASIAFFRGVLADDLLLLFFRDAHVWSLSLRMSPGWPDIGPAGRLSIAAL
jgi:hypothetical protein